MSSLGFRIKPAVAPASPSLVQAFHSVVTPHISDNMGRHIGARGLNRYNSTGKLVGTALTVKTRPGDNLYIYKAMTQLKPGHVLVIDAQGDLGNAVIGELIKRFAMLRGCVGFVVDGAIRDVAAFADTPCYARGITHRGPYKDGPGEVNVPVVIGGMIIEPGDILVGDEDGLVAFAQAHAEDILHKAHRHQAFEQNIIEEIATGAEQQSWLQGLLASKGLGD